jgi:folate-binding protein YgfZ
MSTVDQPTAQPPAPPFFEATEQEYRALAQSAGLVDRSERGKLALSGDGAAEFLNGQVSNDVEAVAIGDGCYATLLTPKGRMLADVRVLRPQGGRGGRGPIQGLWLDTERGALQALFDALRSHLIGYAAELHKHTLQYGLLSLVGPAARSVLGDPDLTATEHANAAARIAGADVLLAVTDVGVDVFCAADSLAVVRAELERSGATPVSEAAVECLRVELGRPRFGLDMDATTMPQEAGIHERAVSYSKGCYVGQETVARLYWKGKPNRHLRGLRLSAATGRGGELRDGDHVVGALGSVALSPRLGPIALALVRREATPGARLTVGDGAIEAELVELPFPRG